ncbi:HDOD domain-containing protein [Salinibius halmophilus]|uniref:HDOD domain-containing protein n=1 Tax=Salinibius halmophilus TaxID=1853216 RepID=UPI000E676744|nr:HDOD domain-containing protein [Salinibius halmophilus]
MTDSALDLPLKREDWVEYLDGSDFSAMMETVQQIIAITEDQNSSAEQLRQVIIHDVGLTSQIVKVANSVIFNASQAPIRTIMQAVLQLGFDEIRNIALSVGVIRTGEQLNSHAQEDLLRTLARSFLTAMLVRKLLSGRLPQARVDEAYIAGLMINVGEVAFLADPICRKTKYFELLPEGKHLAARAVMHMSFPELSIALLKQWQMQGLMLQVHLKTAKPEPALIGVRLCRQIADGLHEGIHSKGLHRFIESWASISGTSVKEAKRAIVKTAQGAVARAAAMDTKLIADYIPLGVDVQAPVRPVLSPEEMEHRVLELMQEFSQLALEPLNINALFELGAKGIFETTGADRVALIIINPRTRKPESRYVYDYEKTGWNIDFTSMGDAKQNQRLLTWIQALKGPRWLRDETRLDGMRIGVFKELLPEGDCMIAPLVLANRLVGFIYADGKGSELTEPVFLRFKLLASQISMVMTSAATHR